MNAEEAITILKHTVNPSKRAQEAIEMAISALENQRELRIGDEVDFGGPKGVVTRLYNCGRDGEEWCGILYQNGNFSSSSAANLRRCRTGRYYPQIQEVLYYLEGKGDVNCETAEWDASGCLGYSYENDDEPVEICKHCAKYSGYEEEQQDDGES